MEQRHDNSRPVGGPSGDHARIMAELSNPTSGYTGQRILTMSDVATPQFPQAAPASYCPPPPAQPHWQQHQQPPPAQPHWQQHQQPPPAQPHWQQHQQPPPAQPHWQQHQQPPPAQLFTNQQHFAPYRHHSVTGNAFSADSHSSVSHTHSPEPMHRFISLPVPHHGGPMDPNMHENIRSDSASTGGDGGLRARNVVGGGSQRRRFHSDSLPGDNKPAAAWVVMQGEVNDADWKCLHDCMSRMGFTEYFILHNPRDVITKAEVERHIKPISTFTRSGANLLLIVVSQDYKGVELEKEFLVKEIYRVVAQFNNEQDKKCKEARNKSVAQSHHAGKIFDGRQYEGTTLHVVLDNVPGVLLPHSIVQKSSADQPSRGPCVQWEALPQTDKEEELLGKAMRFGRIVQFWRDGSTSGFLPFSLFNAFLCTNLNERYLPYNVLLDRMKRLLTATLPKRTIEHGDPPNRRTGNETGLTSRLVGEEAGFMALHSMFMFCMQKHQAYSQKRDKQKCEAAVASGNALCSSANRFDPHLCLDVIWKD